MNNIISTICEKINEIKLTIFLDDIFEKPQGQALLIPFFEDGKEKNSLFNKVDHLSNKRLSEKANSIGFKGEKDEVMTLSLFSFPYSEIVIFGLGKREKFDLPSFQTFLADVFRRLARDKIKSAAFLIDEIFPKEIFNIGKLLAEALCLSQYKFDKYKSQKERNKTTRIKELNVYLDQSQINSTTKIQNSRLRASFAEVATEVEQDFGGQAKLKTIKKGIELGKLISEGIYLARDLVNEPASNLHPEVLMDVAYEIEKQLKEKIKVEVLDKDECQHLGMGAFLGVAQGSEREPKFIILHYTGKTVKQQNNNLTVVRQVKKICLIGKTIIFDSGGLSLKSQAEMQEMKIDMAGGANVLAIFLILSKLEKAGIKISQEIYGLLPVCENMPSGRALKPGDIVTSLNGKTIEVLNTDAEGRLTLADALSYAEKYIKPEYIIDFATLTGAVMVSLGEEITGLFGNNRDFNKVILKTAGEENEAVWELPLFENYARKMKSDIADLKNVSATKYGGAITAALFLQEFVNKKTKWVHLDIAGSSYNNHEEKGIVGKGGTGWGLKSIIRLIIELE